MSGSERGRRSQKTAAIQSLHLQRRASLTSIMIKMNYMFSSDFHVNRKVLALAPKHHSHLKLCFTPPCLTLLACQRDVFTKLRKVVHG